MITTQCTVQTVDSKNTYNFHVTYGDDHEWTRHPSCMDIDETSGNRIFLVRRYDRDITKDVATAEMDAIGFRPAIYSEACAFLNANRKHRLHFCTIVVFGSFCFDREGDCKVLVLTDGMYPIITKYLSDPITNNGTNNHPRNWRGEDLLFVRKSRLQCCTETRNFNVNE